jgi:uncharacterized membrane protein
MTDAYQSAYTAEDRTLPVICYVLYFLGLTHGLTMIIGLIIAYVSRDAAGPRMASHYTWLIRTFWTTIVAFLFAAVVGGVLLAIGIPLSVLLIGIPLVMVGGLLFCLPWVLCLVRLIVGVVHLSRDEAYPRPYATIV